MTRWRRFSLRTFLILFTCFAIVLGYIGAQRYSAKQQIALMKQIEGLGGMPLPINLRDGVAYNITGSPLPEPTQNRWMYWVFGDDHFTYVPLIKLRPTTSADSIRAMVPYINRLRIKEGINVASKSCIVLDVGGNPNVDQSLVDYIESEFPQCKILRSDPNRKGAYE